MFSILACDEAKIAQTLQDLMNDDYDDITSDMTSSLGDPFENETLQNPNWKWQYTR